jgi:hypothetical protein
MDAEVMRNHDAHVQAYRAHLARIKFGRSFANEPGSTYQPSKTFYLDEWRAKRIENRAA